uniref:Ig-like domain-containing protein n=1 Tax=Macrostomum lignano TaxID=282301 RepID=A0A1I8FEK7_9PLAT
TLSSKVHPATRRRGACRSARQRRRRHGRCLLSQQSRRARRPHHRPDGEDIAASPYMSNIGERRAQLRPELVSARGPGIGVPDSQGLALHRRGGIRVDASASGGPPDLLRVTVHNCRGEPVQADCLPRGPGLFQCGYVPQAPGRYTTSISYSGVSIPGSPFRCSLPNPSARPGPSRRPRCQTGGPPEADGLHGGQLESGPGRNPDLSPPGGYRGRAASQTGWHRDAGLYRVERPPVTVRSPTPGSPRGSPFRVPVEPDIDLDKVHVLGLESHVYRDSYPKFRVDASAVESTVNPAESGGAAAALVSGRTGRPVAEVQVRSQGAGLYECAYRPREAGPHRMEVTYAGLPVPGSPFPVEVASGCDPGRVRAHGPGLRSALVESRPLHRGLRHRRQGDLTLAVLGPGQAPVKYRDNGDGTWAVQYTPSERGPHEVQWAPVVKFADCHVPGSPFPVPVESRPAPDRVTAYGPGPAERPGSLWTPPRPVPDTRPSGSDRRWAQRPARRAGARTAGRSVLAAYEPLCEGPAEVAVTFAGQPIPGSPFRVAVRPRCEPGAVVATGPGVRPPGAVRQPCRPRCQPLLKWTRATPGPGELRVGRRGSRTAELCRSAPSALRLRGDADKACASLWPPQATAGRGGHRRPPSWWTATAPADRLRSPAESPLNDQSWTSHLEENADGDGQPVYTPGFPACSAIEIRFGGQPAFPTRAAARWSSKKTKSWRNRSAAKKLTSSSELPPAGPRYPEIDFGLTFDARPAPGTPTAVAASSIGLARSAARAAGANGREPVAGFAVQVLQSTVWGDSVTWTAYGPGLCYGRSGEPGKFHRCDQGGRTR